MTEEKNCTCTCDCNEEETRKPVESVEDLEELISRVKTAQKEFASYSQEQIDKIFRAAALAANKARIPLAKMAVEESGMGVVEDKIVKTTSLQNISTTNSKTLKHAVF